MSTTQTPATLAPTAAALELSQHIGAAQTVLRHTLLEVAQLTDPVEREYLFRGVADIADAVAGEARTGRRDTLRAMRDAGMTYDDIADAVGLSKNRIVQITR